jgi:hypothetical protein
MPSQPREVDTTKADIRTIDSKINLIAQKIRTMEKNEEIVGRTMIALNDRLERLEKRVEEGGSSGGKADIAALEEKFALKGELRELKYIIDTINPLEFATLDQVRELLEEKLKKKE